MIFKQFDKKTGEYIPVDQMGFIHKEEYIISLFESFLRFFKTTNDSSIEKHNLDLYKKYNQSAAENSEPKRETAIIAHVYLMQDKDNFNIKIGVSKDPKERLAQLRAGNTTLELIYSQLVDNAYETEKILHKEYNNKRIGREWFDLSAEDIKNIKKYLKSLSKGGDIQ